MNRMSTREARATAKARWKGKRTRFDAPPEPNPGELIGPVNADYRHGYVMVKAEGMGYYLVHPAVLRGDFGRAV